MQLTASSAGKIALPGQSSRPFFLDVRLLFPVILLVGIGIIMVYSASSAVALERYHTGYFFVKKQVIFSIIGIIGMVVCRYIPYRIFGAMPIPYIFLSVGLILLIMVLIPGIGHSAGGAYRWIKLGPISFQASEFARFAMVIYLGYSLDKKQDMIREISIGFLPHVLVLCIYTALIMLQPDFGTVILLAITTWVMLFVGGVRFAHLSVSLVPIIPILIIYMVSAEYRVKRLISFLDPWQYPANEGYQIIHSQMAFGSGGFWGTGLGQSYQKLFYLPEPHTDFIFSIIGEELGLAGVLVVLSLFAFIIWRGFCIASQAPDRFGAYLATGLTTGIALQVTFNMCVTLGLLPAKGLALPFISYGGSSLIMTLGAIGILMNISMATKR